MGYESKLFAINPDGTQEWVIDFGEGNTVGSSAISSTGNIYVSARKLRGISANGEILWSSSADVWAPPEKPSPALVLDGTIYAVGSRMWWGVAYYFLYAFDSGGDLQWDVMVSDWHFKRTSAPIVNANGIIYIATNTGLRAFNPNGELKWNASDAYDTIEARSLALAQDGTLYVPGRVSGTVTPGLYAVGPSP